MKAIIQDEYGSADVLKLSEIDKPEIGDGDVLVHVHAAGVNIADCFIMRGLYMLRPMYGLRRPRNPVRGTDVAGEVEAVGKDVTGIRPGDEVFGWCKGSFAEYASAPEKNFVTKPEGLTFEEAGGVPLAAICALQAVRDKANVKPGQKVLINGASGGIGTYAVQLAKRFGAEVTGVCSTRNVDLVRSVGAVHVIDYTQEDFTRTGQKYDFIFDIVGNHSLSECRRALTPKGTLIPNDGTRGLWPVVKANLYSPFGPQKTRSFISLAKNEDLVVLKELIEAGDVTPIVDRTYPLSEAPDALRYVEQAHTRGKVVITV